MKSELSFRDYVWERISHTCPVFGHEHDSFDDPWAVANFVLHDAIGWKPFWGSRAMDIGANAGIWTAYCALQGAQVTSYEADPKTFAILAQMIERTGLQERVQCHNQAIYKETGNVFFNGDSFPEGARAHGRNGRIWTEGVQVPAITLSDAIGIDFWDCLKIDIEGAEFDALLAVPDSKLDQIGFMHIEFHNNCADRHTYEKVVGKLGEHFNLVEGASGVDGWESERLHWAKFAKKKQ